jgi:hypothetical protein
MRYKGKIKGRLTFMNRPARPGVSLVYCCSIAKLTHTTTTSSSPVPYSLSISTYSAIGQADNQSLKICSVVSFIIKPLLKRRVKEKQNGGKANQANKCANVFNPIFHD